MAEANAFCEQATEAQARTCRGPVQTARRQRSQWHGERVRLLARRPVLVSLDKVRAHARRGEHADQERAQAVEGARAVALAQRIVKEAVQDVPLLYSTAEPVEECVLRTVVHNPVGPRDEELGRHRDRLRVGHHAVGRFLQAEQDVDRNRSRQKRVGIVTRDARRIVRQELRLDVARDEEVADELAHQAQPRQRERDVELHPERRRGEDHAADRRRVVMDPGGDEHGANALRHDADVLRREAVLCGDVVDEGLHVAHGGTEARRVAPRAGRTAVAARVPGKEIEFGQHQLVDQVRHPRRVLVAAMEEHDRPARGITDRRPVPVEEIDPVVRPERPLVDRPQFRARRRWLRPNTALRRVPGARAFRPARSPAAG
jgi:hypothetical protein